jgi:tetratricopeptide (TPR) repeat protein
MKRVLCAAVVILAAGALAAAEVREPQGAAAPSKDPESVRLISAAFQASYNLNNDKALELARRAVAMDPQNSRVQRGFASILWLDLLFKRGATTSDHYLGDATTSEIRLPPPDPAHAAEFHKALETAIAIAERKRREDPNDLNALYDLGAAYGLQASYTASVEGSLTGAINSARRANEALSTVLEREPTRASAGVIIGTYRYVLATQFILWRAISRLMGFRPSKESGIALLETAAHDPLSRVDAKTALIIIYSRESRHSEAMRLARELAAELPENRLFVLEAGSAAIRAGRAQEADQILTKGLADFAKDTRPKIPGEHALWLYKRGLARLNLNRPADAQLDLGRALELKPEPWVRGRILVAIGKLADLRGDRNEAKTRYNQAFTICQKVDSACAVEARRYLYVPFSFTGKTP